MRIRIILGYTPANINEENGSLEVTHQVNGLQNPTFLTVDASKLEAICVNGGC